MFTERTDGLLCDCEPAADALHGGYHLAHLIGAGPMVPSVRSLCGRRGVG
jgi:hypothetical protein